MTAWSVLLLLAAASGPPAVDAADSYEIRRVERLSLALPVSGAVPDTSDCGLDVTKGLRMIEDAVEDSKGAAVPLPYSGYVMGCGPSFAYTPRGEMRISGNVTIRFQISCSATTASTGPPTVWLRGNDQVGFRTRTVVLDEGGTGPIVSCLAGQNFAYEHTAQVVDLILEQTYDLHLRVDAQWASTGRHDSSPAGLVVGSVAMPADIFFDPPMILRVPLRDARGPANLLDATPDPAFDAVLLVWAAGAAVAVSTGLAVVGGVVRRRRRRNEETSSAIRAIRRE